MSLVLLGSSPTLPTPVLSGYAVITIPVTHRLGSIDTTRLIITF